MEKAIVEFTREEKLEWAEKELEIFNNIYSKEEENGIHYFEATDDGKVEITDPEELENAALLRTEYLNTIRATIEAYKAFTKYSTGNELTDPNPENIHTILTTFETLLKDRPITVVEGTDDEWNQIAEDKYQNKRCITLFKYINKDGSVDYSDTDFSTRFEVINQDKKRIYQSSVIEIFNNMFPITMPYNPYRYISADITVGKCDDTEEVYFIKAFEINGFFDNDEQDQYVICQNEYYIYNNLSYEFDKVTEDEYHKYILDNK